MRSFLKCFRNLHLKGGAVQVDGMSVGNTRKRKVFFQRLGHIVLGACRSGCKVELCDSPTSDTIHPLMLERLEILQNIALLKDAMRTMADAECDGPAALVYQSWAKLQVQALYKRLDEIKEIEHDDFI